MFASVLSTLTGSTPILSEEQRRIKQIVTAIYNGKDGRYTEYSLNKYADIGTELYTYISKLPIDQSLWMKQKVTHDIPGKDSITFEGDLYEHIQFALTKKFSTSQMNEQDRNFFDKLDNILFSKGFSPTPQAYIARLNVNDSFKILEKWCKSNGIAETLEAIIGKFESYLKDMKFAVPADSTSSSINIIDKENDTKTAFLKTITNLSNIIWIYHFETHERKKFFPTTINIDFDKIEQQAFQEITKRENQLLVNELIRTVEARKDAEREVDQLNLKLKEAIKQLDYLKNREIDESLAAKTQSLNEKQKSIELYVNHALEYCEEIIRLAAERTKIEEEITKLRQIIESQIEEINLENYNKIALEKASMFQSTIDHSRDTLKEKQQLITKLEEQKDAYIEQLDLSKEKCKQLESSIKHLENQVEKYSELYRAELASLEKSKSELDPQLLSHFPKYNLDSTTEVTVQNANNIIKTISIIPKSQDIDKKRPFFRDLINLNPALVTTMLKSGIDLDIPSNGKSAPIPLLVFLNKSKDKPQDYMAPTLCLLNFYNEAIKRDVSGKFTNVLGANIACQPHIKRFLNKYEPDAAIKTGNTKTL